jgi:hypothetical protein
LDSSFFFLSEPPTVFINYSRKSFAVCSCLYLIALSMAANGFL